jgi:hypothetical protein
VGGMGGGATRIQPCLPQHIFSFEAPQTHTINAIGGDDNPERRAPVTIFVLDLLNSSFEDSAERAGFMRMVRCRSVA